MCPYFLIIYDLRLSIVRLCESFLWAVAKTPWVENWPFAWPLRSLYDTNTYIFSPKSVPTHHHFIPEALDSTCLKGGGTIVWHSSVMHQIWKEY